jgi:hypothetical protein
MWCCTCLPGRLVVGGGCARDYVSVEEREGKTERQVLVLEAGRLFIYIFIIDRMRRHRESLCSGVDQGKDR